MTDVQPKSVRANTGDEEPPEAEPSATTPRDSAVERVSSPSAPAADAPLWGGRFRIGDEIGRGAMGYVLRATDTTLKRDLAFKVSPLPKDQLSRAELARFIEEAQITAQLEHPNVVPVHDIGLDPEGRAYFSMKLIRGQSLESIFDKLRAEDKDTLAEFGLRR